LLFQKKNKTCSTNGGLYADQYQANELRHFCKDSVHSLKQQRNFFIVILNDFDTIIRITTNDFLTFLNHRPDNCIARTLLYDISFYM